MMMRDYAVFSADGVFEAIVPHAEDKVPPLNEQVGAKAYPVVRNFDPPSPWHVRTGQTEGLVDGQYVIAATWQEPDLAEVKASLRAQVDAKAEGLRLQYITPGQGQVMVYQRKAQEARAILSDADPDPDNYPILSASVGIEGKDIAEVAALVRATEAAWAMIAAAIETARLGGKAAIAAAETLAGAQAAFDAIDWTLSQ